MRCTRRIDRTPVSDEPVLIRTDLLDDVSVRSDADRARIDSIKKAYEEGTPLPPINLSSGDMSINDGNHRLIAARELGLEYVPVVKAR